MKREPPGDEMKCPACGRLELRETPVGVTCRTCGYALTPGEGDKYRLFRLLRDEEKKERQAPQGRRAI
jgi:ribosomal protein L37AE/L43A